MEEKNIIEKLVEDFIVEMNEWEKYCNKVEQDDTIEYETELKMQQKKAEEVFSKYCTKKDRKLGLPENISYGTEGSYEYDPEQEKVTNISIDSKTKATVSTFKEFPMKEEKKYFLKKVKDIWLIDSKKRYSEFKDKWVNVSL